MTTKKDVDIAVLKEQIRNLKENDLAHLAADIKTVDNKLEGSIRDNKEAHEKFETKIDALSSKITKIMAIGGVLLFAAELFIQYVLPSWLK